MLRASGTSSFIASERPIGSWIAWGRQYTFFVMSLNSFELCPHTWFLLWYLVTEPCSYLRHAANLLWADKGGPPSFSTSLEQCPIPVFIWMLASACNDVSWTSLFGSYINKFTCVYGCLLLIIPKAFQNGRGWCLTSSFTYFTLHVSSSSLYPQFLFPFTWSIISCNSSFVSLMLL